MSLIRYILLCFVLITKTCGLAATDTTFKLTKAQWEEIVSGADYTENFKTPEQKEPPKDNYSSEATRQYFTDLKYFMYGALALILIIVIYFLVRNKRKAAGFEVKPISLDTIEDIAQNVHEVDLDAMLKQALEKNDYRLALRINFLIIIKLLSKHGKINWAKEKTNWEYHMELKEKLLADRFREIIISFESFWYGEHLLSEYHYHQAAPLFKAIQNQLEPNV